VPIRILIAAGAASALLALPAWGLAAGNAPDNPAGDHPNAHANANATANANKPSDTSTPGPTASGAEKAKAYGKHCQNQSKKHVKGQKGTPFSQCVTAMAKVAHGDVTDPKVACKTLSKKHVKGQKGTPYSRCVVAAAKLRAKKEQEEAAKTS
jgi:hypothetical protein